jgi:predicted AlkP superfamily phosphohydrolase/phosphomutase
VRAVRRGALLLLLAHCSSETPRDAGRADAGAPRRPRVVVLGFDGVDPDWLDRWTGEGKLPNLQKLAKRGTYRPLRSTNPPQSPVAWTTFATGTLPERHGIFDFIRRNPSTYRPFVGTTEVEIPRVGPPRAHNLRRGEPFWKKLAEKGVRVRLLNIPYSFPPDPVPGGKMLSGLGVPDLRNTNSTFTYFAEDLTPERAAHPPGGGVLVPLTVSGDASEARLEGPEVPGERPLRRMALPLRFARAGTRVTIAVGTSTVTAEKGTPTDWIPLVFEDGARRIQGMARLLVLETTPLRVFCSPINVDPRAPWLPITSPPGFAAELADEFGLFKTVGWDHDTSALNAEVIGEAEFLADLETTEIQRDRMLLGALEKDDWDLLVAVSTATDRVAHMFHRLIDRESPRYDAALAARYGDAIEKTYRRMDDLVGRVLAKLRPDDVVLVLSDHGFHAYDRGLHVNSWLRQEGLLALGPDAAHPPREFLLDVDWAHTKAYALGTGQIYVNVAGREDQGIVARGEEYDRVVRRIADGLVALGDPGRAGAKAVRRVYTRREAFPNVEDSTAPDVQVAFAEGWRTSWETILGGAPEGDLFVPNPRKWSGDHAASDVEDTDGILISSRAFGALRPGIVDVAPTVLALFGVAKPPVYAGRDLFAPPGAR